MLHILEQPFFPDLELLVSFPSSMSSPSPAAKPRPVVLLSHGGRPYHHLSSHEAYAPTADSGLGRGFAVLQPTHLSLRHSGLRPADAPAGHNIHWQWRAREMSLALVVCANADATPRLTVRGAEWHEDAYRKALNPRTLLSARGGRHFLSGVDGWDAVGVEDAHPSRLELVGV